MNNHLEETIRDVHRRMVALKNLLTRLYDYRAQCGESTPLDLDLAEPAPLEFPEFAAPDAVKAKAKPITAANAQLMTEHSAPTSDRMIAIGRKLPTPFINADLVAASGITVAAARVCIGLWYRRGWVNRPGFGTYQLTPTFGQVKGLGKAPAVPTTTSKGYEMLEGIKKEIADKKAAQQ